MDELTFDFELESPVVETAPVEDDTKVIEDVTKENSDEAKEKEFVPAESVTLDLDEKSTTDDETKEVSSDTKKDVKKTDVNGEPINLIYDYLKEDGWADEVEQVTPETVEEQLKALPEKAFLKAVTSMHGDSQELMKYAYNLGETATNEKLADYFNKYIKPSDTSFDFTKEEDAVKYLKSHKGYRRYIRDDEKFEDEISDLKDTGKLLSYAKELYGEDESERIKERKRIDDAAKENRALADKQKAIFAANIKTELEGLGLSNELTSKTAAVLKRENSIRINKGIGSSPKALTQLAHLMTYFNEDDKNFDKLFDILKGKEKSTATKEVEKNINKDFSDKLRSLGKKSESSKKSNIIQVKTIS